MTRRGLDWGNWVAIAGLMILSFGIGFVAGHARSDYLHGATPSTERERP